MCGRYVIEVPKEEMEAYYNAIFEEDFWPSYNISPGRELPVVLDEDPKTIQKINWGLHPPWFKFARGLINIKSESLEEKPFMRRFLSKRCLVPATGFYEWKKQEKGKTPYYIRLKNRDLFSFAGVWDVEKDKDGIPKINFAIITTKPNKVVDKIHNRMPVILEKDEEEKWLSVGDEENQEVLALLKPYVSEDMEASLVSTKVNNPKADSPNLIKPKE